MKNIKLRQNSTIRQALSDINEGAIQIALVVDDDEHLVGTISDGDIRRGLLAGMSLESSIESIINKNPIVMHENESNEEILQRAQRHSVRRIPVLSSDNKVIAIEEISALTRAKRKENQVILMVGGLGTRLRPLTNDMPKPMLNVGQKPILETIVEQFSNHGYRNITMCVNYKADIIKNYFGNGSSFGVNIEYVLEHERMGTAGALSLLDEKPKEDFFVMNGDLLTNLNFSKLHENHARGENLATMCIREYEMQIPYGVVNLADDGTSLLSITEKPTHKFFVSAGIYMLSPKALEFVPKGQFYDMPTLFSALIAANKNVGSYTIRDYWLDIGQIDEYKRANAEYSEIF